MSINLLLFFLRLLSSVILLAFVGGIGFYLYTDMQIVKNAGKSGSRGYHRISVLSSDGSQRQYLLRPITTIGRAENNTIVLASSYASSQHAIITLRNKQWWVEDNGSSNGTILNEALLTEPAVLVNGSVIRIGKTELHLEI